ncbi:unnamed protein product [Amoebophrya sp. A120]|nr:unnamed protein product [Amoebophrya sp. A120]|eukprot:GSA120T00025899001.1
MEIDTAAHDKSRASSRSRKHSHRRGLATSSKLAGTGTAVASGKCMSASAPKSIAEANPHHVPQLPQDSEQPPTMTISCSTSGNENAIVPPNFEAVNFSLPSGGGVTSSSKRIAAAMQEADRFPVHSSISNVERSALPASCSSASFSSKANPCDADCTNSKFVDSGTSAGGKTFLNSDVGNKDGSCSLLAQKKISIVAASVGNTNDNIPVHAGGGHEPDRRESGQDLLLPFSAGDEGKSRIIYQESCTGKPDAASGHSAPITEDAGHKKAKRKEKDKNSAPAQRGLNRQDKRRHNVANFSRVKELQLVTEADEILSDEINQARWLIERIHVAVDSAICDVTETWFLQGRAPGDVEVGTDPNLKMKEEADLLSFRRNVDLAECAMKKLKNFKPLCDLKYDIPEDAPAPPACSQNEDFDAVGLVPDSGAQIIDQNKAINSPAVAVVKGSDSRSSKNQDLEQSAAALGDGSSRSKQKGTEDGYDRPPKKVQKSSALPKARSGSSSSSSAPVFALAPPPRTQSAKTRKNENLRRENEVDDRKQPFELNATGGVKRPLAPLSGGPSPDDETGGNPCSPWAAVEERANVFSEEHLLEAAPPPASPRIVPLPKEPVRRPTRDCNTAPQYNPIGAPTVGFAAFAQCSSAPAVHTREFWLLYIHAVRRAEGIIEVGNLISTNLAGNRARIFIPDELPLILAFNKPKFATIGYCSFCRSYIGWKETKGVERQAKSIFHRQRGHGVCSSRMCLGVACMSSPLYRISNDLRSHDSGKREYKRIMAVKQNVFVVVRTGKNKTNHQHPKRKKKKTGGQFSSDSDSVAESDTSDSASEFDQEEFESQVAIEVVTRSAGGRNRSDFHDVSVDDEMINIDRLSVPDLPGSIIEWHQRNPNGIPQRHPDEDGSFSEEAMAEGEKPEPDFF